MFWSNANSVSNTIWAALESIVIIGTPIFFILKGQRKLDKRLDRIEYALFNDGKTGLINKFDALIEDFQGMKTDVAVLKSQIDE
jgi:hypothetical protein